MPINLVSKSDISTVLEHLQGQPLHHSLVSLLQSITNLLKNKFFLIYNLNPDLLLILLGCCLACTEGGNRS